ncbi:hypothetical protein [Ottowia sp.]|uniref:hypothetical protein n=1 Tax=Ottowia sp. TaxID=1898956 RepID=UPI003A85EC7B
MAAIVGGSVWRARRVSRITRLAAPLMARQNLYVQHGFAAYPHFNNSYQKMSFHSA